MTINEDDVGTSSHYTHLLIGTSLTLSILSAALSLSPANKVLHIDPAEYYGSFNASLTLTQMVEEIQRRDGYRKDGNGIASKSSPYSELPRPSTKVRFPYFDNIEREASSSSSSRTIPPSLQSLDRHYSLSLSPALQPASSSSLDVLIRSQVAKYATFRLLQRTAVWDQRHDQLRTVPASKEDVFKSGELNLIEKRKLMKFLQFAANHDSLDQGGELESTSSLSLPFRTFLEDKFKLPAHLIDAIMYGIALCATENEATAPAMQRLKVHLMSVGRYGNSAYLVPQYGGAGEIAQGYCRAAAVHGATFILGKEIEELVNNDLGGHEITKGRFKLKLKDIEEIFLADRVIAEEELVTNRLNGSGIASQAEGPVNTKLFQAILVLDRSVRIPAAATTSSSGDGSGREESQIDDEPLETGLIVFPPGSLPLQGGSLHKSTMTALILGEGTFCCPKGQYVVHLTTQLESIGQEDTHADLAEQILSAAKAKILPFAKDSPVEWSPKGDEKTLPTFEPLVEAYWLEDLRPTYSAGEPLPSSSDYFIRVPRHFPASSPSSPTSLPLATLLDTSVSQATQLFYTALHAIPPPYPTTEAYLRKKRGGLRTEAEFKGRGGVGPSDLEMDEDLMREEEEEEDQGGQDGEAEEIFFFFPPDLELEEFGQDDAGST